jgi:hypothetical protein
VVDGSCADEVIDFRIPLRGMCRPHICPSVTNVFNKFSVRFFVRAVVVTEQVIRKLDQSEEVTEELEVTELEGGLHELVLWRGGVSMNECMMRE